MHDAGPAVRAIRGARAAPPAALLWRRQPVRAGGGYSAGFLVVVCFSAC